MQRAMGLAVLLVLPWAARAAGPEADRASAELGFSELQRVAPIVYHRKSSPKPPAPAPKPPPQRPDIKSALDFSDVTWPPAFDLDDKAALSAALNISGSFEGDNASWDTITGNFDGQGLSLGLLNQCLGQGSLQPLLAAMRRQHPERFNVAFSSSHLASIDGMLDKWEQSQQLAGARGMLAMAGESAAGLGAGGAPSASLSILDEPEEPEGGKTVSPEKASVAWAMANLYTSTGAFVPEWRTELMALAAAPEYVSLQVAAALGYHDQSLALEKEVGIIELRAYLLMFDFVVQNGGLHPEDLTAYRRYVKTHPKSTSSMRLEQLLTLRLRHVRRRFVSDVRSRKRCIIRGAGKVHGNARDLPKEFNYDSSWPYKKQAPAGP